MSKYVLNMKMYHHTLLGWSCCCIVHMANPMEENAMGHHISIAVFGRSVRGEELKERFGQKVKQSLLLFIFWRLIGDEFHFSANLQSLERVIWL